MKESKASHLLTLVLSRRDSKNGAIAAGGEPVEPKIGILIIDNWKIRRE